MLLQRLLRDDRVEKELTFFLIFLRAAAVTTGLRHVIAPLVIELGKSIELFLEFLVGFCGVTPLFFWSFRG